MQGHRYPPSTNASEVPETEPVRWLPALTVLASAAGLIGAVWLAVSMLF